MTLSGCIVCGLVLERDVTVPEGHLAAEACPDCGQQLRAVDVAEAAQLSRERYLAARWRWLASRRMRGRRAHELPEDRTPGPLPVEPPSPEAPGLPPTDHPDGPADRSDAPADHDSRGGPPAERPGSSGG